MSAIADSRVEVLTLKGAVSEALQQNRDLQAARFAIDQAEGRLRQAGLWPNPELELTHDSDSAFNNEGESSASAGFKQPFPISGRLSDAKAVARVDVAQALAEVRNQERLLIGDVVGELRKLGVLQEKLDALNKIEEPLKKLVSVSEKRLKLAEVSQADLNLEKIELQKLSLERSSLLIEKKTTTVTLNQLLGREPNGALEIDGEVNTNLALGALSEASREAVKKRPDYQLQALQIDRASSELRLARAERFEDWTIGLGYSREKQVFDSVIDTKKDEFLGVTIDIPLPLWNQNQGRIAEVSATQSRARKELAALELRIRGEVESAETELHRLAPILSQYREESIPLAEENVKLLHESYTTGLVGVSSVIQAQQQLSEIRRTYADVVGQFVSARTRFETATASSPFIKTKEQGLPRK